MDKNKRIINIMLIIFGILYIISIFIWISEFITLTVNYSYYNKYLKNCPYIISDLEYNLHIKKRCELYNINHNSRYSYQYICSYNSSKDFKNELSSEIKKNNVICLPFKEPIQNNKKINLFLNEYKNEEKFYCSRTNIPDDYPLIKHKDCNNNKKHKFMLAFVILSYFRILFIFWPILCAWAFGDDTIVFNQNNINFINNFDLSRKSTNISETHQNDEIFKKQETINIIIENKKEFIVNTNIEDLKQKNENINNTNNTLIIKDNTIEDGQISKSEGNFDSSSNFS